MFNFRVPFDQSTYINNVNQLINFIKQASTKENPSTIRRELQRGGTINVAEAYKTIKLLDEAFAEVEIPKDNKELNAGGICRALVSKWQKAINAKYYTHPSNDTKLRNFERRIKWITGLEQKDIKQLTAFIYQKDLNNQHRLPTFKKTLPLNKKLLKFLGQNGFSEIFKSYIDDQRFFSLIKANFLKKLKIDDVEDDQIAIFAQYFVKAVLLDQLNYVKKINKVYESAEGAYNVENQNYALETGMTWLDTYPVTSVFEAQKEFIKNFDTPKTFLRFYSNRHVIGLHLDQKSSSKISYDVYDPNETKGVQSFNTIESALSYINTCLEKVDQNLENISVFIPDVAKNQNFFGNYPELEELIESLAVLLPFLKEVNQTKLQAMINFLREDKLEEITKALNDFMEDIMAKPIAFINDKKQIIEFLENLLSAKKSLANLQFIAKPKKIETGLYHSLIDAKNVILQAKTNSNTKQVDDIKNTAKTLWNDYVSGRVPLLKILKNYASMLAEVGGLERYYDRINYYYQTMKSQYIGDLAKNAVPKYRIATKFEQRSMFNAAAKAGAFYWFLDQVKVNRRVCAENSFSEKYLNELTEEISNLFKNENGEIYYTINDLNELEKYLQAVNGESKKFEYSKYEEFKNFKTKYQSNPEYKNAVDFLFDSDQRLFLNANADSGYTPLYEAIIYHHFDIALLLVQNGGQVNRKLRINKKDSDNDNKKETENQQTRTYLQTLINVYKGCPQNFKDPDFKTLMLKFLEDFKADSDIKFDFKKEIITGMHDKKDYDPDIVLSICSKFILDNDLTNMGDLIAYLVEDRQYSTLNAYYSFIKTQDIQQQAYFLIYLSKEIFRQQGSKKTDKESSYDHKQLKIPLLKELENTQLHSVQINNIRNQENFLARLVFESSDKLSINASTFADEVLSNLIDKKDELKVEITPLVLVQLILKQKTNLLFKIIEKKLIPGLLKSLFQDAKQKNNFGMLLVDPQKVHEAFISINKTIKLRPLMKELLTIRQYDIHDGPCLDFKIAMLIHFLMMNHSASREFQLIKSEINALKKLVSQEKFKKSIALDTLNYYRGLLQNKKELISVIDELETFPEQTELSAGKDKAAQQLSPVTTNQIPTSTETPKQEINTKKILSDLQDIIFNTDWPVFGTFKLGFFGSFKIGGIKLTLYGDKNHNEIENTTTDTMHQMMEIMEIETQRCKNNQKPVDYGAILEKVYQEGHKRCIRYKDKPSHKEKLIDDFYHLFAADSFEAFKQTVEDNLLEFLQKPIPNLG